MSDIITIGRDRPEEEILTHEVSDEALETVASTGSKQGGELHDCILHLGSTLPSLTSLTNLLHVTVYCM
jgi:hypothetical protein